MTDPGRSRSEDQGDLAPATPLEDVASRQVSDTRRRGRSNSTRPPDRTPSTRQFLFIDNNADRNAQNEAVRVHVMRESHRHRRETRGSQSQSRGRRIMAQDDIVIFDSRSIRRPTSLPPSTQTASEEIPGTMASSTVIDWPAVVRAGASESTMGSLPELSRLAEGYLRSVRLLQPDVLHLCQGDLLSISAYLALAALQFSTEDRPANIASDQFESRALDLLRQRLAQSSRMHEDTTIIAVLLLSQLEQHKNNTESALFHRNALRRMVQDRGGLTILHEQNSELSGLLSANDILSLVE